MGCLGRKKGEFVTKNSWHPGFGLRLLGEMRKRGILQRSLNNSPEEIGTCLRLTLSRSTKIVIRENIGHKKVRQIKSTLLTHFNQSYFKTQPLSNFIIPSLQLIWLYRFKTHNLPENRLPISLIGKSPAFSMYDR